MMHRILIVDDEPMIVDNVGIFLADCSGLDVDICHAYTAADALQWAGRTRIDILISDMRMPGMSGTELQQQLLRLWPRCRIIFLTAYDDLTYAQEAIFHGQVTAYLIKNTSNAGILQAVEKAIEQLNQEMKESDLLHRAGLAMKLALPVLRKQFLESVLQQGESFSQEQLAAKFAELEIDLKPHAPGYLLLGRIDAWEEATSTTDKMLMLYAVQNIAEEYMHPYVESVSLANDASNLVWILQPHASLAAEFVFGILEAVQSTCKSLLRLPLSFVWDGDPAAWPDMHAIFHRLKQALRFEFGGERELLMQIGSRSPELDSADGDGNGEAAEPVTIRDSHPQPLHAQAASELAALFESCQKDAYFAAYREGIETHVPRNKQEAIEVYYALALFFTSYLNRTGLWAECAKKIDLHGLAGMGENDSWPDIVQFFKRLAKLLFDMREKHQVDRVQKMVYQAQHFIKHHLHEDLSLTRVSSLVHLSPTYFSRLYKKTTGVDFTDFVTEQRMKAAKEILRNSHDKIYEVAAQVGYDSVPNFIRVFKKCTLMTPQEFRDEHQ